MMTAKQIIADNAPKAIGPYSQGVEWGGLLFLSGQIPLDPKSGNIVGSTIEDQTTQVMKNLDSVLKSAGSDLSKVLKCTVFLSDLEDFPSFNKVYGNYFTGVAPARSTVQVARLPRGAKVEIDLIASRE